MEKKWKEDWNASNLIRSHRKYNSKILRRRKSKERKDDSRSDFFRDYTRIIHCINFRSLRHKTQVFFMPHQDKLSTRLDHALTVASVAKTIGLKLGLDLDLIDAIGHGHDIGHLPFGHFGEEKANEFWRKKKLIEECGPQSVSKLNVILDKYIGESHNILATELEKIDSWVKGKVLPNIKGKKGRKVIEDEIKTEMGGSFLNIFNGKKYFSHEKNGLRIVQKTGILNSRPNKKGLNLTYAVEDGIACHCGEILGIDSNSNDVLEIKPRFINESNNSLMSFMGIDLNEIEVGKTKPITLEGCIVLISDFLSYLGRDIEDAYYAGVFKKEMLNDDLQNNDYLKDIYEDYRLFVNKNLNVSNNEAMDLFPTLINKYVLQSSIQEILRDKSNNNHNPMIVLPLQTYDRLRKIYNFNNKYIYKAEILNEHKRRIYKLLEDIMEEVYFYAGVYVKSKEGRSKFEDEGPEIARSLSRYLKEFRYFENSIEVELSNDFLIQLVIDYLTSLSDNEVIELWEKSFCILTTILSYYEYF